MLVKIYQNVSMNITEYYDVLNIYLNNLEYLFLNVKLFLYIVYIYIYIYIYIYKYITIDKYITIETNCFYIWDVYV